MVNWHDAETTGQSIDGISYTLGAEVGTPRGAADWLTRAPLAQVVNTRAELDDLPIGSGLGSGAIALSDRESLRGRAMMAAEFALGGGSTLQFDAGLSYEFMDGGSTTPGSVATDNDLTGLEGEISARANFKLSNGVSAFADFSRRQSIEDDTASSNRGMVGLRIDF